MVNFYVLINGIQMVEESWFFLYNADDIIYIPLPPLARYGHSGPQSTPYGYLQ